MDDHKQDEESTQIKLTVRIKEKVTEMSKAKIRDDDLLPTLETLTMSLKQAENRKRVTPDLCLDLVNLLVILIKGESTEEMHVACEVFRCLRNACAGNKHVQDTLYSLENGCCFHLTVKYIHMLKKLLHDLSGTNNPQEAVYTSGMKCAVQFLGNAAAGHSNNQKVIWDKIFPLFGELLTMEDNTLKNYVAMVIYNCLSPEHCQQMLDKDTTIIFGVISLFSDFNSEWSWFIFERMIQIQGFVANIYQIMDNKQRLKLLAMIKSGLEEKVDTVKSIEYSNIQHIANNFIANSHIILSLSQQNKAQNMEPLVVVSELDVLCTVSSQSNLQTKLQQESDLIPVLINLLHCVNMIGEEGDNLFSGVTKVSEMESVDQGHPGFGLRKDLIRLMGNMAYQHKANQDKIRELGGLRLILEHTKIDARNPFICQWAVLAVRNLCEGNHDNQSFIRMLNLQGVTNNQEISEEFGVTAEAKDGNVVLHKVDM